MASPLAGATATERLLTGSYVIGRYLWVLLWPAKLTVDYSPNEITRVASLGDLRALLGLGVLTAYAAAVVLTARRSPVACWMLVAVAAIFAPAANVAFPIGTIMAERLMYLPVLALLLPLSLGLWKLAAMASRPWLAYGLAVLLALGYAGRTRARNEDWRSDETLFRSALQASPQSAMANKNYASILQQSGRVGEAIPLAENAIRIVPDFPDAHLVLGNCYHNVDRYRDAEKQYRKTLELVPGHASAHLNLGATYLFLKQPENALRELDAALALQPNLDTAWFNKVHALVDLGRLDDAERTLQEAVARFPNRAQEAPARQKVDAARSRQQRR
jgi:tetratricopeptide (TPR) repeat protein